MRKIWVKITRVRAYAARTFAASIISLSIFASADADQFQDGLAAANKGEFGAADKLWSPLAELGNLAAQLNEAILYRDGKGVPQNYSIALWWTSIAAKRNYPLAQKMLADMYATGQGAPMDKVRALTWYLIATSAPNGQGDDAKHNRDIVQSTMTVEEIKQANETGGHCLDSKFTDCEPSISIGGDTMFPIYSPIGSTPVPPVPMNAHSVVAQDYPLLSIRRGEQGRIDVQYLIGIDGQVGGCAVMRSSGWMRLDLAACSVAKRWFFKPASENGQSIPVSMTAEISFLLR